MGHHGAREIEQKAFMKRVFIQGMGFFSNRLIDESRVQIALEPEAGLMYQIQNKPTVFDRDHVVAIFDFGGGTFDLTVVNAKAGQAPEVIVSDFGDVIGGSDIDKAFLDFLCELLNWFLIYSL